MEHDFGAEHFAHRDFAREPDVVAMALEREALGADADDDTIDDLHASLLQALLDRSNDFGVEATIDLALVGRYYERLADHATSISHAVTYLVTGEHHDPESYAAE